MDIESIVYHPFCDVRLGIYFEVCRLCHVILFRNIYAAIMPWDLYQIAAVTPSPPPQLTRLPSCAEIFWRWRSSNL